MRRLTILPQAELDVSDATAWYEGRRTGLGEEFLDNLDSLLRGIIESPFQFPKIKNNIRRALLGSFPYSVYFGVSSETVELVAVLHQHGDPRTWQRRIVAE